MGEALAGIVGGLGLFIVGMRALTENPKTLTSRRTRRRAASLARCAAASAKPAAVTTVHAAPSLAHGVALLTTRDDVGHVLEPQSRSMSVHSALHRMVDNPTSAHP